MKVDSVEKQDYITHSSRMESHDQSQISHLKDI